MHDAAWVNAQLATMVSGYGTVVDGVVAVTHGKISWVGPRSAWRGGAREEHDARGAWITVWRNGCSNSSRYGRELSNNSMSPGSSRALAPACSTPQVPARCTMKV